MRFWCCFVRPSHPRAAAGQHGLGRGIARAGSARSARRRSRAREHAPSRPRVGSCTDGSSIRSTVTAEFGAPPGAGGQVGLDSRATSRAGRVESPFLACSPQWGDTGSAALFGAVAGNVTSSAPCAARRCPPAAAGAAQRLPLARRAAAERRLFQIDLR